ncbi:MAG: 50S ribosomal protein L25 [Bacteroidetes bacterium]|nr:50S ribosomal protein L25 [Bacteroidota bacterium]
MKEAKLLGKKREEFGKGPSYRLRTKGLIPCTITRKDGNVNFYSFINDFNDIIFTPETYLVNIDVEGENYKAIVQERQFNSLSDEVTHVDFLEVSEDKPIKCELPIKFVGKSKGVAVGGKLAASMRRLKVKGMLKDLPEAIEVNITHLDLGKSIKVREVKLEGIEILNPAALPIATIEIPRALKSAASKG